MMHHLICNNSLFQAAVELSTYHQLHPFLPHYNKQCTDMLRYISMYNLRVDFCTFLV